MRRTQLHLDVQLWNALHARARHEKVTVSELVREAIRERYLTGREERVRAMRDFVGARRNRSAPLETVDYVRSLRKDGRLARLYK